MELSGDVFRVRLFKGRTHCFFHDFLHRWSIFILEMKVFFFCNGVRSSDMLN